MLFSGAQDSTIRVWKPDQVAGFVCSGVLTAEAGGHLAPVSCLCAAGPYLFSADFKGNIKVLGRGGGGGAGGRLVGLLNACGRPHAPAPWDF